MEKQENLKSWELAYRPTLDVCRVAAAFPLIALLLLSLAACFPSLSFADFSSNARGTAGANFLKLGTGARSLAMGGAASAVTEDPTALYWNPACLSNNRFPGFSLMQAQYLESISYTDAALALPLRRIPGHWFQEHSPSGVLGFGATLLDFGSIQKRDLYGASEGSYRPRAMVLSLGYAGKVEVADRTVWWGATAKYLDFKIADRAVTKAIDAGVLYRPTDRLSLAFAVQNLGSGMKFDSKADKLPLTCRLGSGYAFAKSWLAALDVVQAQDNAAVVQAGIENRLEFGPDRALNTRLGYSTALKDVGGFAGPSFGFGLGLGAFSFDYAFIPIGDLGATHRAGVTFRWSRQVRSIGGKGFVSEAVAEPAQAPALKTESPAQPPVSAPEKAPEATAPMPILPAPEQVPPQAPEPKKSRKP